MAKIAVKLLNNDNRFNDDDDGKFVPHETRFVEESERIKNAIAMRILVRDREAEAIEPVQKVSKPVEKIPDAKQAERPKEESK